MNERLLFLVAVRGMRNRQKDRANGYGDEGGGRSVLALLLTSAAGISIDRERETMDTSSLDAVLHDLRGEIDASFAEQRQLLESVTWDFCQTLQSHQSRLLLLQRSGMSTSSAAVWGAAAAAAAGSQEREKRRQRCQSTGTDRQWDALNHLLASIDESKPKPTRTTSRRQQRARQPRTATSAFLPDRNLLRTQLLTLTPRAPARSDVPLRPEQKRGLTQRCLNGWRVRVRDAVAIGKKTSCARSHFQNGVRRKTFRLLVAFCAAKRRLMQKYHQIALVANAVLLRGAYSTWTQRYRWQIAFKKLRTVYRQTQLRHVFHRWIKIVFYQHQLCVWQHQKDQQRCRRVFTAWCAATVDRRGRREMFARAATFSKQKLLVSMMLRLKRVAQKRAAVSELQRRHVQSMLRSHMGRWCAFVEAEKRYRFASKWSRQHQCATVFDQWCAVRSRHKRNSRVVQSFSRRRMRNLAKAVLVAWTRAVGIVRKQKAALVVPSFLSHSQSL